MEFTTPPLKVPQIGQLFHFNKNLFLQLWLTADGVLDYKFNPILEPEDILEWILGL